MRLTATPFTVTLVPQKRLSFTCGASLTTTMENKLIVVVCRYPEFYGITSYFYKNAWKKVSEEELFAATRPRLSSESSAPACRSPSHDANSRLCSEFHARMVRISRVIRVWCECTLTNWVLPLPNSGFHYFLEILDFLPDTKLISVIWTMRWTIASCPQCCTLILI